MKYTIPYEDKITLPHVKDIDSIGINAEHLSYDTKELTGEVIVSGDYLLDNSEDVMEFRHDIPVSFLIDDDTISPQINISNFNYELIPGRGLTVIFDLDIILDSKEERETDDDEEIDVEEKVDDSNKIEDEIDRDETDVDSEEKEIKEFQEKIDENLDLVLNNNRKQKNKDTINLDDTKDNKGNVEVDRDDDNKRPLFKSKKEKKETIKEEKQETPQKQIQEEQEETQPEAIIEVDDDKFETIIRPTASSFDTGFIPRDNDKLTTYKIILIENNENIDELLESRNLSKALICKEYQFDNKIVLKIEDD